MDPYLIEIWKILMFRIFFVSLASILSIYIIFSQKNVSELWVFSGRKEGSSELVPIAPQTSFTYKTPLEEFFSINSLRNLLCQFLFFNRKNTVLTRIAGIGFWGDAIPAAEAPTVVPEPRRVRPLSDRRRLVSVTSQLVCKCQFLFPALKIVSYTTAKYRKTEFPRNFYCNFFL